MQAGDQFEKRKRFAQIVVGTVTQSAYAVFDPLAGGEHDHRGLLARAQGPQHAKAVEPREHDIEHDHRVITLHRQVQPLDAIAGHIHRIALLGQPAVQVVGGFFFIFNNQNAHDPPQ